MSNNWARYNGKIPDQQIIMIDQKDKESQRLLKADKKKIEANNKKVEAKEND